jgi:hypothetical protein
MVMRKDPLDSMLPGVFIKVPTPVLNSKLSHAELRLWLFIEAHRFSGKESCYPSNDRLADLMGLKRRRIIAMKSALVEKGFLAVKDRPGKSALLTPLVNAQPVQHNAPVQKSAHLETLEPVQPTVTIDISSKPIDPCTKEHGGVQKSAHQGCKKMHPNQIFLIRRMNQYNRPLRKQNQGRQPNGILHRKLRRKNPTHGSREYSTIFMMSI